ncbi:Cupredoxin [Linderina pennispora]|uniref:Cupredoxin n=1 Tax=Linderina pennispora TaxID=61395 RepID=A0A1Y1W3E8_9FUNG|nr:Cupredoxin [Linderina pennispora]ORX68051.1 Cupredoxin [Linderina pennispora]
MLKSLIGLALAATAAAKEVTYYWDVTYTKANPDGLFERQVSLNDTLVVEMRNSLNELTTLHAHGLYQNGTNYYDGPDMVTQCGVPPGSNMTYRIPIQQTGTYWIHSHWSAQYIDGLRAPLIIKNPDEPHEYDEDITLTFEDWYHDQSADLLHEFLNWKNPGGAEPVPNSALIGSVGGATKKVLDFKPGKTYRIRLINMSAQAMFHFSIDGHEMQIIEPMTVGNRTSVLVTALNSTDNNYQFHADMDITMFDSTPPGLDYNSTGIIQYAADAPIKEGYEADWSFFDDATLVPYKKVPAFGFDVNYNFDVWFLQFTDSFNHWHIQQQHLANNKTVYGPQTNAEVIQNMQEVQFVINNYDAGTHPFHLHGHHFQIVGRGEAPYDPTNNPRPKTPPIMRDTVTIPSMEYVVLRFRADNPGVHLMHCHLLFHALSGLNMIFIDLEVPQQIYDHCEARGIKTSGNAAGREGFDLTGAPYGPFVYPQGWTKKAKGALAGCVISALLGICTIFWYGWTSQKAYKPVMTVDPAENINLRDENERIGEVARL